MYGWFWLWGGDCLYVQLIEVCGRDLSSTGDERRSDMASLRTSFVISFWVLTN
jgi:hypothetical protein